MPHERFRAVLTRCQGKQSQGQLAKRLDVSRNTIGVWLTGTFLPDRTNYLKLLQMFPEHAPDLAAAFHDQD